MTEATKSSKQDNRFPTYEQLFAGWEQMKAERNLLRGFTNGLLGLIQLLSHRDDLPAGLGEIMLTNHRYVDALAYIEHHTMPADETTPEHRA